MPPKAASSCSSADDEFDDDGFDWDAAAVETLAETEKKVKAATEREEKIHELIKEAEQELQEIARLRRVKGSGHPGKKGPAGTEKHKLWTSKLARLNSGLLPGESVGAGARSDEQLHAAAQQHAEDHAAAGNTTRHDHAQLRAELWRFTPLFTPLLRPGRGAVFSKCFPKPAQSRNAHRWGKMG